MAKSKTVVTGGAQQPLQYRNWHDCAHSCVNMTNGQYSTLTPVTCGPTAQAWTAEPQAGHCFCRHASSDTQTYRGLASTTAKT